MYMIFTKHLKNQNGDWVVFWLVGGWPSCECSANLDHAPSGEWLAHAAWLARCCVLWWLRIEYELPATCFDIHPTSYPAFILLKKTPAYVCSHRTNASSTFHEHCRLLSSLCCLVLINPWVRVHKPARVNRYASRIYVTYSRRSREARRLRQAA